MVNEIVDFDAPTTVCPECGKTKKRTVKRCHRCQSAIKQRAHKLALQFIAGQRIIIIVPRRHTIQ